MANAFFMLDTKGKFVEDRDDKIIPDPVEYTQFTTVIEGRITTLTGISGSMCYPIVDPGDYPADGNDRERRRGSIRA